jgi:ubiquinone/menaquinone biosynthesis C-methylase UbiE
MTESNAIAAGKSSYDLVDSDALWSSLALAADSIVLDLGCGAGRYALPMASQLGSEGRVIALDLWTDGIEQLKETAATQGITNLDARVSDATNLVSIEDRSIDVCFMATVLHDLVQDGTATAALEEMKRVLKPGGIMAVVEFKKEDRPNGPPRRVRLAVEDLAMLVQRLGFIRFSGVMDLGPELYLAQFRRLTK